MWYCVGCSSTKYKPNWKTWPDFLSMSLSDSSSSNIGVSGAANELISRLILKNAKKNDSVVVMWSGFNRYYDQEFTEKFGHDIGRNKDDRYTINQLLDRTVENIWTAQQYCRLNEINLYQFTNNIFELGGTKKIHKIPKYLDIGYKDFPMSIAEFSLDHPSKLQNKIDDTHPFPSQHYKYFRDIISPIIKIKPVELSEPMLDSFDAAAVKHALNKVPS